MLDEEERHDMSASEQGRSSSSDSDHEDDEDEKEEEADQGDGRIQAALAGSSAVETPVAQTGQQEEELGLTKIPWPTDIPRGRRSEGKLGADQNVTRRARILSLSLLIKRTPDRASSTLVHFSYTYFFCLLILNQCISISLPFVRLFLLLCFYSHLYVSFFS